MNEEYEKCFHEHHTDTFHKTLKAAKAAVSVADGKYPQVYRCWRKDGVIAGEEVGLMANTAAASSRRINTLLKS